MLFILVEHVERKPNIDEENVATSPHVFIGIFRFDACTPPSVKPGPFFAVRPQDIPGVRLIVIAV